MCVSACACVRVRGEAGEGALARCVCVCVCVCVCTRALAAVSARLYAFVHACKRGCVGGTEFARARASLCIRAVNRFKNPNRFFTGF